VTVEILYVEEFRREISIEEDKTGIVLDDQKMW